MGNMKAYKDKPIITPIHLGLVESEDGVFVAVVDDKGDEVDGGYLLHFYHTGKVLRLTGVSSRFGLPLDDENRIKFDVPGGVKRNRFEAIPKNKLLGSSPTPPPQTYLHLEPAGQGVRLVALDQHGQPARDGNILYIDSQGIRRDTNVSGTLGLQLNDKRQIFDVFED